MISIQNEYKGRLRTAATHLKSKNEIITDAPVDNQGKGEAFSPTDLVAGALSACMMTIMGQVAEREQINMEGLITDVTKVMGTNPRRIIEIVVSFNWPDISMTAKQKAMLMNAAKTCPVAMSIHPDIKQTVNFNL